jgi:hypothetical protein
MRIIKDKDKLEALKLSDKRKTITKNRIKVEHVNVQLKNIKNYQYDMINIQLIMPYFFIYHVLISY